MAEEKKNVTAEEVKEIPVENLEEVAGGAIFDIIPKSERKIVDDK